MSSVDPLDAVLKAIAEEARRSPDFLARLERALGLMRSKGAVTGHRAPVKRPHRRTAAVLDPFEVLRESGPQGLRMQLSALTLDQLRDVVAEHRVEPYALAMKWKSPTRLADLITETIEQRARKGDSFRLPPDRDGASAPPASALPLTRVAERAFTPAAVEVLWERAEAVVGVEEFVALVSAHRGGDPSPRHQLVDQLIRLDDASRGKLTPIAEDAAAVSAAEVDSILTFAEGWQGSPAWPEVRRGLRSAAEYLHSVGVLAVASMLRVRHPTTELVVSAAGSRKPDVMLVVSDGLPVAVEVKAPQVLWQPTKRLDLGDGLRLVRNALANAGTVQGQLSADRPGVLAFAGLLISQATYDTLVRCFEMHLAQEGNKTPHLLGIAVFNLRQRVVPEGQRVATLFEQQSVLRRNRAYAGPLTIDSDWAGPWRLVRRDAQ